PGPAVDVLDAELLLGPLDRGLALRRAPDRGPRAQTVGVLRRRLGVLGLGRRLRVGRGVRGRVRGRRRLVAPALVTVGHLVARAALVPIRSLVARVVPVVPVAAVAAVATVAVPIVAVPIVTVLVLARVGAVAVLTLTPLALALATLGGATRLALALDLAARLAGRSEPLEQILAFELGGGDPLLGLLLERLGGRERLLRGDDGGLLGLERGLRAAAQRLGDERRGAEVLDNLVGACPEHLERLGGLDELGDPSRLEHRAHLVPARARAHRAQRDRDEPLAGDLELGLGGLEPGRGRARLGGGRVAVDERLGVVLGGPLDREPCVVGLDRELGEADLDRGDRAAHRVVRRARVAHVLVARALGGERQGARSRHTAHEQGKDEGSGEPRPQRACA